jgi:CheY-like chemotaxis protein
VEDDADGREVLTALLEVEGAKVTSAGSVRAALDVLDGMRPDVIVSDIGMPDEDGYALARRVRARELERGGGIPMIALTGYVNPEDRAALLAVGFQATLRKPVDADDIVAVITSLIHGQGENRIGAR